MPGTLHNSSTDLKTVLVIGGNGFLGSHVSNALSQDLSFTVVVASRRPSQCKPSNTTWRRCDITKLIEVQKLFESVKPTVVIHAVTPGPFAMTGAQAKHYEATKNLLEEAKKSKFTKAFIYTGSGEAIANGTGAKGLGLREQDAVFHSFFSGPTPYARSKGACQSLVLDFNSPATSSKTGSLNRGLQDLLLTTVLCVPGIYGPRDTGITPGVFKLPTRLQLGPNKSLHEWVYVENAAYAYVLAAKALVSSQPNLESAMKVDGELFFITDGQPINFWNFARKFKVESGDQVAGDPSKVFVVPWGVVLVLATISEWVYWVFTLGRTVSSFNPRLARYIKDGRALDISKARDSLGYEPLVSLDEGVRRSVRWFLQKTNM
jgi:sterol-4alpha-carboxylate 3-dehydrogenase (decarboxylating)